MFGTEAMHEAVSGRAWVAAMLEAEAALAAAEARAGLITGAAAAAIAAACDAGSFDIAAIAEGTALAANPAGPLVEALRRRLPPEAAGAVHLGATSQDIVDTAMMLIGRRALALVVSDLDGCAAACAALADRHRTTVMAGRTLLQQAVPITFGLKAAGWLSAMMASRSRLEELKSGLAAQLGGAAGTLASLGSSGEVVSRYFAEALNLRKPLLPWHTDRTRIAELGAALGIAAGAAGKIALDVELLAQSEVGEVTEAAAGGRGRSSAMPHKRNPVFSVACGPECCGRRRWSRCCWRPWRRNSSARPGPGRRNGGR